MFSVSEPSEGWPCSLGHRHQDEAARVDEELGGDSGGDRSILYLSSGPHSVQ